MSLLEVSGLSKSFGGLHAVREVSFRLEAGEILGIVGPNGAGKSTLVELISGGIRADHGSVHFRGHELIGRPPHAICRLGLARTFQKLRPFAGMTVLDNVMVNALVGERSRAVARGNALRCLDFVGLAHKREALAGTLSTGQRKRLELARAMASRPSVYMLDEVMAGVDHRSLAGLVDLIAEFRKQGSTILIIEHNLPVLRRLCDRLIAMHLGEKIADGEPDQVLSNETVVRAYVGE